MKTTSGSEGLNRWRSRLANLRGKPRDAGVYPPQQIPLTDFVGSASSIELYAAGKYGYKQVDQDDGDDGQIVRTGGDNKREQAGMDSGK